MCACSHNRAPTIADIAGYFPEIFIPLVPERLLIRASSLAGYSGGKPAAGDAAELHVTGQGSSNIPADVAAVALNVTVTSPATDGFVTLWPCRCAVTHCIEPNFTSGQTVPNLAIVGVGSNCNVCLYTMSGSILLPTSPATSFHSRRPRSRTLAHRRDRS